MTTHIASNSWEHCSKVTVILINPIFYFLQESINIVDAFELTTGKYWITLEKSAVVTPDPGQAETTEAQTTEAETTEAETTEKKNMSKSGCFMPFVAYSPRTSRGADSIEK